MFITSLTILSLTLLFLYCSLLFYFKEGFNRLQSGSSTDQPTVTIIIPAHNEANNLPSLLERLTEQTYPKELIEIVLVDDRSTDRTYDMMLQFSIENDNVKVMQIKIMEPFISPKKYAIQQAIHASTHEIILLTDADTLPNPNWITETVKMYDREIGMVIGYAPFRTDSPYSTLFHQLLALEYFGMGAIAAATAGMGHPITSFGANLSYRRKLFEDCDGFGDSIKILSGDDDLFLHRAQTHLNYKIRFASNPESPVYTNPPINLSHFIRQRIRFSSKHLAYPKPVVAVLSAIYAFYLCLFVNLLGCLISHAFLPITIAMLTIKTAFEIPFLLKAQKYLEKRKLLIYYPLAIAPHILYVVLFPILGQLLKKRW
jgi:cellulose synthase/poly-beta-1,6-N-acetylglucosamine synthase-like glycosyltransferase